MQIKCSTCKHGDRLGVYCYNVGGYCDCVRKVYDKWEAKPALPTCPFCGGESELKHYKDDHVDAYWLKCKKWCPGEQNHPTPEAAIEAYGRRA